MTNRTERIDAALRNAALKLKDNPRIGIMLVDDNGLNVAVVQTKRHGVSTSVLAWAPAAGRVTCYDATIDEDTAVEIYEAFRSAGVAALFVDHAAASRSARVAGLARAIKACASYEAAEHAIQSKAV